MQNCYVFSRDKKKDIQCNEMANKAKATQRDNSSSDSEDIGLLASDA